MLVPREEDRQRGRRSLESAAHSVADRDPGARFSYVALETHGRMVRTAGLCDPFVVGARRYKPDATLTRPCPARRPNRERWDDDDDAHACASAQTFAEP